MHMDREATEKTKFQISEGTYRSVDPEKPAGKQKLCLNYKSKVKLVLKTLIIVYKSSRSISCLVFPLLYWYGYNANHLIELLLFICGILSAIQVLLDIPRCCCTLFNKCSNETQCPGSWYFICNGLLYFCLLVWSAVASYYVFDIWREFNCPNGCKDTDRGDQCCSSIMLFSVICLSFLYLELIANALYRCIRSKQ